MEEGPTEHSREGATHSYSRGVNAYEAIRRADEEAEAAIALDQTAFTKPSQTLGSAPASPSSETPVSGGPTPVSPAPVSPVPVGTETAYSPTHQRISRTAANRALGRTTPTYEPRSNQATQQSPLSKTGQPGNGRSESGQPEKGLSKLLPWRKAPAENDSLENTPLASPSYTATDAAPDAAPEGRYVVNPVDGSLIFVPTQAQPPTWWKQPPYYAIAHLLAISGTFMGAWFLGVLVAQVFPGNFEKPPLQESVLRKTSRLRKSLWHFPQLWQSATTETRIEAIPLPDTGPVTKPIRLPPIERQPLIDELNAIETEVLTLDRRIQILEKQLGRPPYEGADIDQRLNSLRAAIDPPVTTPAKADYVPEPVDPSDRILDVAERKITLPADALFTPGESVIKDATLLNQVLDQLVNYPGATVVVSSYSDNQANAIANREYTLAQANALSQHLQAALPKKYRWITVGGGENWPVDSNETLPGRQRNRRIEILIDTR